MSNEQQVASLLTDIATVNDRILKCVVYLTSGKEYPIWFDKLYAPDTNSWNNETDYNWHAPLA